MKLIVATGSKYRKKLFDQLNISAGFYTPDIEEQVWNTYPVAGQVALYNAKAKVEAVKEHIHEDENECIIMGFDTITVCNNKQLDKPGNKGAAFNQLKKQSGNESKVYTSMFINCPRYDENYEFTCHSTIKFKELSMKDIEMYIEKENSLDSCGAVVLESRGLSLVDEIITDDFYSLIGVPVIEMFKCFDELGYSPY